VTDPSSPAPPSARTDAEEANGKISLPAAWDVASGTNHDPATEDLFHIVLLEKFQDGRIKRDAWTFLCDGTTGPAGGTQATDRSVDEHGKAFAPKVTCKACLRSAARIGARQGKERPKLGRPTGSKTEVSKENERLEVRIHEFAFARALAEGFSYEEAADRYLVLDRCGPQTARKIRESILSRCIRILHHYLRIQHENPMSGRGIMDPIESAFMNGLPAGDKTTQLITQMVIDGRMPVYAVETPLSTPMLEHDANKTPGFMLRMIKHLREINEPADTQLDREAMAQNNLGTSEESFDVFCSKLDRDGFSEDEVLTMYLEANPELKQRETVRRNHIAALNWLLTRVAIYPKGTDFVSLWFSDSIAKRIRVLGVLTLANAATAINLHGRNWHAKIQGLGREKALQITKWLISQEKHIGVAIKAHIRKAVCEEADPTATAKPRESAPVPAKATGLFSVYRPITDGLSVQEMQQQGRYRSTTDNSLNASCDEDAVKSWLLLLSTKSPKTMEAYARDVERLLIWADRECGKKLSDLTFQDAMAYRAFLLKPPAHWVNPLPLPRTDPDWRPMRGPLSPASLSRNLAAIKSLYKFLVQNNYLRANPFSGISTAARGQVTMDTTRSFTPGQLLAIVRTMEEMPDGPDKNRYFAICRTLLNTGLRRIELCTHSWHHIRREFDHQLGQYVTSLYVIGKGNKERAIPLSEGVLEALQAHRNDYERLAQEGKITPAVRTGLPLIAVLGGFRESEAQGPGDPGELLYSPPDPAQDDADQPPGKVLEGALSDSRLYRLITALLEKTSEKIPPEERERFLEGSPHWFRHTFAHTYLKDAGKEDIATLSKLLAHESLTTTGIYVKASMADRVEGMSKFKSLI